MSRKWSSSTWLVSRRSSWASSANTWSRISGTSLTSWRKRSRGRTSVSVALDRRRGRGPRRAVEQREGAEELARPERREDRLDAGVRRAGDLHPAGTA